MPYYNRPRKPRPTWVIQDDIDKVVKLLNERPTQYNANYYDSQRRLKRELVMLRDELRRAEALYLRKPQTPEADPAPDQSA